MVFHRHHHGGLLSKIEDEIEQLAIATGGQGANAQQQTVGTTAAPGLADRGYGQGMYGNYSAGPGNAPYGQYNQPMQPPYGSQQGYSANASGTVFGGADEGAPGSYQRSGYPSGPQGYPPQQGGYGQYGPPQPQGYPQGPPPPSYGSPYGQGPPPPNQYGAPQNTQYSQYPPPGQPQYPLQGGQGGQGPPQYPPQQYPPQGSQYPSSNPPRPGAQYPGPSPQPGSNYAPSYQSGPPQPYDSQPYPPQQQPPYSGNQAQRTQGTGGMGGMGGLAAGAAVAGAATLAYGAYQNHQNATAPIVDHPVPNQLTPSQVEVPFEPLHGEMKHMSHHHAMHLLSKAHHSEPKISQIIGTYLMAKVADGSSGYGTPASRPEVKQYYHEMDKLEKLSKDFLSAHSGRTHEWKQALGPHRRYVFAQLYNRNELVRAFCQEMQGGPLALPALDPYSLGERIPHHHVFGRSAVRQVNKSAALSLLARVRTVLLIDDSYSMHERGHSSWGLSQSETRWQQTREVIGGLAPLVATHNAHGIDIHYLNRVAFQSGVKNQQECLASFDRDSPNNGTPTGARVNDILDAYLSVLRYYRELLPLNLIIVTDGEANDEELLHQAIEHHVTEIVHRGFPAHQFGVEFVQVGDCEYAAKHLEKLEKEVSRHHHKFQRDVVGVTPIHRQTQMSPNELLAIAVSGIDARVNGYMRDRGVNV